MDHVGITGLKTRVEKQKFASQRTVVLNSVFAQGFNVVEELFVIMGVDDENVRYRGQILRLLDQAHSSVCEDSLDQRQQIAIIHARLRGRNCQPEIRWCLYLLYQS